MVIAYQNSWLIGDKYWENSHAFIPDRFVKYNEISGTNNAFTPFGIGRRKCIGEKYALNSLFLIFTKFIQKTNEKNFKLKIIDKNYLYPDRRKLTFISPKKYELSFKSD